MARLNDRLSRLDPAVRDDVVRFQLRLPSVGAVAALAAGLMVVAYMAIETSNYFAPPPGTQPASAIATLPADPGSSMGDAAFVASVPTGMPVWPAVLMLGQAPMRFADLDFRDADGAR
jgi:hypothetical protein